MFKVSARRSKFDTREWFRAEREHRIIRIQLLYATSAQDESAYDTENAAR
jgi:hypothetical protein